MYVVDMFWIEKRKLNVIDYNVDSYFGVVDYGCFILHNTVNTILRPAF